MKQINTNKYKQIYGKDVRVLRIISKLNIAVVWRRSIALTLDSVVQKRGTGKNIRTTEQCAIPHLAELHVAFDTVEPLLKLGALRVHVRNHAADLADDRREDEDAREEVDDEETILGVVGRLRDVGDRRQRQRRPEVPVEVHAPERPVLAFDVHRVYQQIGAEADPAAELDVDARVPVDDDEDVDDQRDDAEDVRIARLRLGAVDELEGAAESGDAVDAYDRRSAGTEPEVEQVGRQEADDVEFELKRRRVVSPQLFDVGHDETLLEVGWKWTQTAVVGRW